MYYRVAVFFFIVCLLSNKVLSQKFDSVHVYAVYMKSMYRVKINKELIKNEAAPISVKDADVINGIDQVLLDTVRGRHLKKIKSNNLDVRLIFEFFNKGEVSKVVGLTSYGTMFIDQNLYQYDKARLKHLEKFVPGLTNTLGVKG